MASLLRNGVFVTNNKKQILMVAILICGLCVIQPRLVWANSYLEMITTPPAQNANTGSSYVDESSYEAPEPAYVQVVPQVVPEPVIIPKNTTSPVVTPMYPKYVAWKQAQSNKYCCEPNPMQNLIYFMGGALVGRIAYDIWGPYHKHHLLDHW